MTRKKNILVIIGSASHKSANQKLVEAIANLTTQDFYMTFLDDLHKIPHFNPELSTNNPPKEILKLREAISHSDGVLICTPEYIFSIPSGLKNVFEWCVATAVFSDKPVGLITASAHGEKSGITVNYAYDNGKIQ